MMSNKSLTYTKMRAMNIRHKLLQINPDMRIFDIVDVVNTALVVFSYICDEHVDEELEHGELVHDLVDNKKYFIYNINSLIYETREQNRVLDEYINKEIKLKEKVEK